MTEPDLSPELVAVGKAIRALRECRGMSVAQLAAAADTTDETVEAVEDGRNELRWGLLLHSGRRARRRRDGHRGPCSRGTRLIGCRRI
jgi:DNA-binding XRE family transcriptional regulator